MRAALAVLLLTVAPAFAGSWYESYGKGVRLIASGDAVAARAALEEALKARPAEGLQLPAGPHQYLDYLPHLYLAIANQMTGDMDRARTELERAETSGIAAKSEVGRPLLVAYQLLLRGDTPGYAKFDRKKTLLSDAEFQTLRNDVLSQCDLPLDTPSRTPPGTRTTSSACSSRGRATTPAR